MSQLNRKNSQSWSGGETLWASHTNVLLILPAPPLPCLTLSHRHAPWLFKSSFHGDSILKFSRSRTGIIFYLLLLLRGNLGKGSLLQIKRGVRGEGWGGETQLSFIAWLDKMVTLKLLIPSFPRTPHPQPSWSFLGVLGHLFLTCLCFNEEMGEGKVRKEEIKEEERERVGWYMPNCKYAHTHKQCGYRKFPLIPLWEVT